MVREFNNQLETELATGERELDDEEAERHTEKNYKHLFDALHQ